MEGKMKVKEIEGKENGEVKREFVQEPELLFNLHDPSQECDIEVKGITELSSHHEKTVFLIDPTIQASSSSIYVATKSP